MRFGSNRLSKVLSSILDFVHTTFTKSTMMYTLLLTALISLSACSDSIQKMQASIYEEYTEKIKDVTEYDSLKKINDRLNNEFVTLFKENSEQLLEESKKGNKGDIKELKEAEKRYVDSYIGKIAPQIIKKKNSAYDNAITGIGKCASTSELTSLNSKTYNDIKKIDKANSWELKEMNKRYPKEVQSLTTKSIKYNTSYIKAATPFIIEEIKRYTAIVEQTDGYEELKEIKNEYYRKRNMFCTEKDTILNLVFNEKIVLDTLRSSTKNDCLSEIKSIIETEAVFDSVYMNKFIPFYLEKEKEFYEGVTTVLESSEEKQLLNDVQTLFPGINNNFHSINLKERRWLENRLKEDSTAFKEYILPRDEALQRMNTLYNEKIRGSK